MVFEQYVSFETAKLLQEKGFDAECDYWYSECGSQCCSPSAIAAECYCPTQSLAMRWLREEKGIYIEIRRNLNTFHFKWCIQEGTVNRAFSNYKYNTLEETCEAAIKYCLENLI